MNTAAIFFSITIKVLSILGIIAFFFKVAMLLEQSNISIAEAATMFSVIVLTVAFFFAYCSGYLRSTPEAIEPQVFDTYSEDYKKKEENRPTYEGRTIWEYWPSTTSFKRVRVSLSCDSNIFEEVTYKEPRGALNELTRKAMLINLAKKEKGVSSKLEISEKEKMTYKGMTAIMGGRKPKQIVQL